MKKLLLVWAVAFFSNVMAQTVIDKGYYLVEYSMEYKQPLNVSYNVECPESGFSRKGLSFFTDGAYRQSGSEDYYKNVWDKGHMAPAASFDCTPQMLKSTFSYLNCALQHEKLNRGAWKYLEMYERRLALYTDVRVDIKVHFDKNMGITPGGARIPSGFTKTLTTDDEVQTFYFNNEAPLFKGSDSFRYYQIK